MNKFHVFLSKIQYILCLVAVIGVLVYLASQGQTPNVNVSADADREVAVRIVGQNRIVIAPDSPLAKRLYLAKVETAEITTPLVTVTGVVAASLRPGNGKGNDYWQFHTSDLLTAYTDWQTAVDDVAFHEEQMVATQQLVEAQVDAAQKKVERLQRLVTIGTEAAQDLAEAQAELIHTQIQGRKDVHEAETDVRKAKREETMLARQLEQSGLDPPLLASAKIDIDIIIAEVPESWIGRIAIGQSCEARFISLPDQTFNGNVHAIVSVLSSERRSLRVLLSIHDPDDKLRPGMFVEIGLGTDPHKALLAPADAIIHIGRADYVLVYVSESTWWVASVKVGEIRNNTVEILEGLQDGEQIAGRGAILLKPSMIKALQAKE
jgi:hypothetical protein